jgi:hypothetical protein
MSIFRRLLLGRKITTMMIIMIIIMIMIVSRLRSLVLDAAGFSSASVAPLRCGR